MGRSEFCFPSSSPRPGSQAVLPNQQNFRLYSPYHGLINYKNGSQRVLLPERRLISPRLSGSLA
jgi:hypothetical protein